MILLLGGTGFIGAAFARSMSRQGIAYRVISRKTVDYTSRDRLVELIQQTRPTFLINAAGYTGRPNVDACERHKPECLAANAVLPGIIRQACEACRLPWGHVSSGCIYTGTRPDGAGFRESDPPNFCFRTNNCSFYSGCKAIGEEVLWGAEQTFVWRLRMPFSEFDSSRNYLSKLIRYRRLLDVTNSLTHLEEFADCCLRLWEIRAAPGIYNVTNTGAVSTRELVSLIQRYLMPGRAFDFFEDESEFMRQAALTPRSSCVLDNSKLIASGVPIRTVTEAVQSALQHWVPCHEDAKR